MAIRELTLALLWMATAIPAQQLDQDDPYTLGARPALDAAGYANLGPFPIGGYHGTGDVDQLLAPATIRWIETAHFKIGSTLATYRIGGDDDQRQKIRAELAELKLGLPAIDPSTRSLDPWLRTHLLAMRCEKVYADFRDRLGYADRDFPQRPQDVRLGPSFLGIGPHLGQREKYVVLVFEHAHEVAKYSREHLGAELRWPQRYNLGWKRSLLFVTSPELGGWLPDDTAMHVHLVYDVVQMLCDGFRSFGHETPVWFKTGLAQWYGRRIDARYPNFDRPPRGAPKSSSIWKWEPIVARLCRDGEATPMAEMASWRDYGPFAFEDYVVAHARVAFLLEHAGDDGLARFLFRFKAPLTLGRSEPGWELVLAQQDDALVEGFGFADWDSLDTAWRASVSGVQGRGARRSPGGR